MSLIITQYFTILQAILRNVIAARNIICVKGRGVFRTPRVEVATGLRSQRHGCENSRWWTSWTNARTSIQLEHFCQISRWKDHYWPCNLSLVFDLRSSAAEAGNTHNDVFLNVPYPLHTDQLFVKIHKRARLYTQPLPWGQFRSPTKVGQYPGTLIAGTRSLLLRLCVEERHLLDHRHLAAWSIAAARVVSIMSHSISHLREVCLIAHWYPEFHISITEGPSHITTSIAARYMLRIVCIYKAFWSESY